MQTTVHLSPTLRTRLKADVMKLYDSGRLDPGVTRLNPGDQMRLAKKYNVTRQHINGLVRKLRRGNARGKPGEPAALLSRRRRR